MKTKLLLTLAFIGMLSVNAQTTYNLNWEIGSNGTDMDITVEVGDTVIWTWTDSAPHTVENVVGSSVETFNSGSITGNGMTYSYTFNVIGLNDYFCGIHGAASMNGRITVEQGLSVDDKNKIGFEIMANPAKNMLNIQLPQHVSQGKLVIHDVLGKQMINKDFNDNEPLQINVSEFQQGVYLITIEAGDSKQTKRFIKN